MEFAQLTKCVHVKINSGTIYRFIVLKLKRICINVLDTM